MVPNILDKGYAADIQNNYFARLSRKKEWISGQSGGRSEDTLPLDMVPRLGKNYAQGGDGFFLLIVKHLEASKSGRCMGIRGCEKE